MAAGSQRRYRPTITQDEMNVLVDLVENEHRNLLESEQPQPEDRDRANLLDRIKDKLLRVSPATPKKPRIVA